jgi:hypothetical protein
MKKLTTEKLIQYMKDRTDEPLRQDPESLAKACNTVAAELNHDNAQYTIATYTQLQL